MTTEATQLNEYVKTSEFANSEKNPVSPSEFRWLFRQRDHNGFLQAFVKLNNRKFLLHIPTFLQILDSKRGQ